MRASALPSAPVPDRQVVFLGIAGSRACKGPYGDAQEAHVMQDVAARFARDGRGVFWDLCAGSLEEGLGKAVDTIRAACNEAPVPPTPNPPAKYDGSADGKSIE